MASVKLPAKLIPTSFNLVFNSAPHNEPPLIDAVWLIVKNSIVGSGVGYAK